MASPKHFNPGSGSPPHMNLFSNVTIVPARSSLAFISTQWAADPATGELVAGTEGDYEKQAEIVTAGVVGILKELGVGLDAVVHRTVNFAEYDEEKGKATVTGLMKALPDEWKPYAFKSALTFNKSTGGFHLPGIVFTYECIVAVPAHK